MQTSADDRKWLPRLEHLWLALPLLIMAWIGLLQPIRLIDFWWHLKAGEVIVDTRSVPKTDLFSFTAAGEPFVLQNWLAETLMCLVHRAGGLEWIVVLNAGLLTIALLFTYRSCLEAADRRPLGIGMALAVVAVLFYYSSLRTQTFSFAMFAFFYWVLTGYCRRRRQLLWTLPILSLLWVNLHGAFVLGLGLIALFLAGESLRRVSPPDGSEVLTGRELGWLAVTLVLSTLATLANPQGPGIYVLVWEIQQSVSVQQYVLEWQPPRIEAPLDVWLFWGPLFLSLFVLLISRRRPTLTEILVFLAFAAFGVKARRNGIWLILVAAPLVARYLPGSALEELGRRWRRSRVAKGLAGQTAGPESAAAVQQSPGMNLLLLGVLVALTVLFSPWVRPRLGGASLVEPATPVGALDYMEQRHLVGNVFHPQIYGSYLTWRLWPEQRAFFDGRVHLYPESLIRDYQDTFRDPQWEARLAAHQVRYLLLDLASEDSQYLHRQAQASPDWVELYADELSVLLGKTP